MNPRVQLRNAAKARKRASRIRVESEVRLRTAIRLAADAGISKTEIAELAEVSRQTVHQILKGRS